MNTFKKKFIKKSLILTKLWSKYTFQCLLYWNLQLKFVYENFAKFSTFSKKSENMYIGFFVGPESFPEGLRTQKWSFDPLLIRNTVLEGFFKGKKCYNSQKWLKSSFLTSDTTLKRLRTLENPYLHIGIISEILQNLAKISFTNYC